MVIEFAIKPLDFIICIKKLLASGGSGSNKELFRRICVEHTPIPT
jgi:hypothetical protein